MKGDNFGDRMKHFEAIETGRQFIPMLPIYTRIDGKGFSKFTKGLARPYDTRMVECMVETAKHIVKETNARIGYTQSDELSFVWLADTYDSEIFFNGKIQKMVSVLASMATAKFTQMAIKHLPPEYAEKLPCFDCRVFQLPSKVEATNAMLWREQDASKNSISMAASHYYSHKELDHKSGSEKQEMLFQKGVNYNDYPPEFKRGTFVRRVTFERTMTADELTKINPKPSPCRRSANYSKRSSDY